MMRTADAPQHSNGDLASILCDPQRLDALERIQVSGAGADVEFDRIAQLAAKALDLPFAAINFVEPGRQLFKGCVGLPEPYATTREVPASWGYCQFAIERGRPLLIEDVRTQPRYAHNPAASVLGVVAYAGVPLIDADGNILGALCVVDGKPHAWSERERELLDGFAALVIAELRSRLLRDDAQRKEREAVQKARLHELASGGLSTEMVFEAWCLAANALPTLLYTARPDGSIEFLNARWNEMTGLHASIALEDAWPSVVHPDDLEAMAAAWEKSLRTGARFQAECRLRKADGTYFWVFSNALPQQGTDGEIARWYGSCVDIGRRKQAEAALAESERHFKALADAVPVIVWTADASGWIYWYNQGWYDYTGQTPQEAAGWGWQAAHHPDDLPRVMQEWPNSIATGEPFETEFRLRRADGEFHTVLTRAIPVRNGEGRVERWYGSNADIQAQKEALQRSQHVSETLQGVFLPERLPHTESIRVDAVYQAADKDALVGGDWFDAIQLPDGRYLVSIGDVAGHGLDASIIAGRLRHAVTDFAFEHDNPAAVLRCVNHVLRREHPQVYATAVVAFIDPSCSKLSYASAGHQPPMIAGGDGSPPKILPYGGLLLGVEDDLSLVSRNIAICRDDALAFYTDGLTEFARDVERAERQIAAALGQIAGNTAIARPAAFVRDAVLAGAPTTDDAALLIVQFSQVTPETLGVEPAALEKTWRFHSSDAYTAHISRRELMKFIRRFAADSGDLFAAELILGEILANTVEHAPGLVDVRIDWRGAKPIVTVHDSGPGLNREVSELPAAELDEKGRGLFVIRAFAEQLSVTPSNGGGTALRAVLPLARNV